MLTVGLTGGIAAGKSVVAGVFARRGAAIFDADREAKALLVPGGPAYAPLVEHFGRGILSPDGTIDRRALAARIFAREDERRFVNGLVHPLVAAAQRRAIARLEAEGRTAVFVSEAALIIEAGLAGEFDRIVVAWCPLEVQVGRLMARDGLGREDALRRIGSQMPTAEKLRLADYVIETSGSIETTTARAEEVWTKLLDDAARRFSRRRRAGES